MVSSSLPFVLFALFATVSLSAGVKLAAPEGIAAPKGIAAGPKGTAEAELTAPKGIAEAEPASIEGTGVPLKPLAATPKDIVAAPRGIATPLKPLVGELVLSSKDEKASPSSEEDLKELHVFLDAFTDRVAELAEVLLRHARKVTNELLGNGTLDEAADHFGDFLREGIQKIREGLKDLGNKVFDDLESLGSGEKESSGVKKGSVEKKEVEEKKVSGEKKEHVEKKGSVEKKDEVEKKEVGENKVSGEKKGTVEKKDEVEKKEVGEKKKSVENKASTEKKTTA